jgi:thiol-disulfide isomerase/thioredoxin
MRWLIVLLCGLLVAACNPLKTEDTHYQIKKTPDYDPLVLTPPAEPAPIEGDFRRDAAARLAFADLDKPILIFIYDDLCGNCLALRPLIAQLETDYWGKVEVAYLERDDLENLGYEIFAFLKAGDPPEFFLAAPDQSILQHWQGAPPIEDIRAAIDEYLANSG